MLCGSALGQRLAAGFVLAMVLFATVSATAGHLKDTFATPPLGDWLTRNVDTSVRAGDDFFTYANGGCLRRNPIPASESQTMIDF